MLSTGGPAAAKDFDAYIQAIKTKEKDETEDLTTSGP
jgi:hypothetical protein